MSGLAPPPTLSPSGQQQQRLAEAWLHPYNVGPCWRCARSADVVLMMDQHAGDHPLRVICFGCGKWADTPREWNQAQGWTS